MAEADSVVENTHLQEIDAMNVVSALGDHHIRLENLNPNQIKEQQDQTLGDEDIKRVEKNKNSLQASKEWTLSKIDSSHKLLENKNLSTESLGAPVQESREVLANDDKIFTQNFLVIPEREKTVSVNLGVNQGQYSVSEIKGDEMDEKVMEQNQDKLSPSLVDLKKIKGQTYQKSAEMQCNSQQMPEVNQVSKLKEQAKQMENLQIKKQKTGVVGDNHERINYLVQVSRTLVNMGQSDDEPTALNFDKVLASQTGLLATAVGRKSLVRLSPSLKRVLCKGCGTMLIYGVNARVRQRSNRQRHLAITCLVCNTIKRLVCDARHKLWCEQEEAVV